MAKPALAYPAKVVPNEMPEVLTENTSKRRSSGITGIDKPVVVP